MTIRKIPAGYQSKLNLLQTELAIKKVKDYFESNLAEELNLIRVSAPILVKAGTGINDNLNGVERMVSFDALDVKDTDIQVVQSLAKWKRLALAKYGIGLGKGLYTDMNAIRRDEILSNLHSMYVDQWDWEKVISKEQRNVQTLQAEVRKIYNVLRSTEIYLNDFFPALKPSLPMNIHFVTTQELEDQYPHLTPKEREDIVAKEYGAVFISQIGGTLKSGNKHDGRSPDYDDWNLNGDIVLWNPTLEIAFEVSSMGIRVDEETLLKQLMIAGAEEREQLEFHQAILNEEVPYTMGGGIGQSRLCMFFLQKAHIGEVQVSIWNEEILQSCKEANIQLL